MVPELASRLAALEKRRHGLLDDYARLTPEQLAFRPASGSWSLLEVAEHLWLAERVTTTAMESRTPGRRPVRRLTERLYGVAVTTVLRFGLKARVPSSRLAPQGKLSLEELRGEWKETGDRLRALLEKVPPEEVGSEAFRHPLSGPLDFRQGLDFLGAHFDHHLRQVRRIRGSGGFPGAAVESAS